MSQLVILNQKTHTYWCGKKRLQSVGGLVKSLVPPFDRDRIAARIAKREGKTPEQIIAGWEAMRDEAADKGYAVHDAIDCHLKGKPMPPNCEQSPVAFSAWSLWLAWWKKAGEHLTVKGVEVQVADLELSLAGTFDLLALSSKTGKEHIFDWKTNKKFAKQNNYGENLLEPFSDLPNCEYSVYSLQVNLYRLIRERAGHDCGDSWIVHVNRTLSVFRALDLRARLKEWLGEKELKACEATL